MSPRRCALLAAFALAPVVAQADTVASLLGNFTVNQYAGVDIAARTIDVRYAVVFGQIPALRELHVADADGDGVTTEAERTAYARKMAPAIADAIKVAVDGVPVPLRTGRVKTSLPDEQGGFSLRVDVDLTGAIPGDANAVRSLTLRNDNFAGRFGWQEIVVNAAPGLSVFATNAFGTSLTHGLTEAVTEIPASGPLAERDVHMSVTSGTPPAGARLIGPRDGAPGVAAPADAGGSWLARETRRLVGLISGADVGPQVALVALAVAMFLGALHAFAPGHGKTVVGAYLIGSRATARHAAFLGLTVTVTHTIGVFALGFATLAASAYVLPERIFPILGFASGLIVLGMGVLLLKQRWPAARDALARRASAFRSMGRAGGSYVLASMGHAHAAAGWHSHGGTWHTHAPPGAAGEAVTWRSLLALGVSGGLVPCPSAMVLLLAAVALHKTAFGLALVFAFSLGLAATLTAIGFLFLYARNRIPAGAHAARWTRVVPVMSAAAITAIGVLLCYGALSGTQI